MYKLLCSRINQIILGVLILALLFSASMPTSAYTHLGLPVQPRSQERLADTVVDWMWSGAVTPDSLRVNAELFQPSQNVRLAVSQNQDMSAALFSPMVAAEPATHNMLSIHMQGLLPDTQYYYTLEVDGALDMEKIGRARTFPLGAASFDFVLAADAVKGSNQPVFETIAGLDADFFMNIGDLFYANIAVNDELLYREAYTSTLRAPRQAALYRSKPIVYMWDDHDYGPNDSDSTSPSRQAAMAAYRAYVPHYPLGAAEQEAPIYQAFTVGRVRFILTDLRSARSPDSTPDGADKTMMGAAQKAWFKQELLAANGNYPLIFWVSSVPWIAGAAATGDNWGGFATERSEIADFIEQNDIQGLIALAADAHMLALDDGTHNVFSASGLPMFPVFQAAALGQTGSSKGGPYTFGPFPNPTINDGQFAHIFVTDDGSDQVCVRYSGQRLEAGGSTPVELIDWSTCFSAQADTTAFDVQGFQDGVPPNPAYAGTRDTTLSENAPAANLGADTQCLLDGDDPLDSGLDLAALLRWDLSAIAPDSPVTQANLVLHVTNPTTQNYSVYAALQDWDEIQATWLEYQTGLPWQSPGAGGAQDRGALEVGRLEAAGLGYYQFALNADGLALLQSWIDNPGSNYGLILAGSDTTNGLDFDCREISLAADRPRLNIRYQAPAQSLGWIVYLPLVNKQ